MPPSLKTAPKFCIIPFVLQAPPTSRASSRSCLSCEQPLGLCEHPIRCPSNRSGTRWPYPIRRLGPNEQIRGGQNKNRRWAWHFRSQTPRGDRFFFCRPVKLRRQFFFHGFFRAIDVLLERLCLQFRHHFPQFSGERVPFHKKIKWRFSRQPLFAD